MCFSANATIPPLQIRLTLAKKDYVRALIQSRKINRKVLLDEDMQDIKVTGDRFDTSVRSFGFLVLERTRVRARDRDRGDGQPCQRLA